MSANHYDVIVIGVGSMGSSTCYQLSERGFKVLGLEQFGVSHEHGSHTGQSRIIRKAYFEHQDYVPLLERAYENWRKLAQQTGVEIYHQTGIVYFGPSTHPTIAGVKQSAALYNLDVKTESLENTKQRFPLFEIPPDFETLFEKEAGFVIPEKAIITYTTLAKNYGAVIKTNERVVSWKEEGGKVIVTTNLEEYTCDKLVITAGSWTAKLLPGWKADLKVTRQLLAWIKPPDEKVFSIGNFPCWFIEDPDKGMFYGFPVLPAEKFDGPVGLKIASHRPGDITDPDNVNRTPKQSELDDIRYILSKYIPSAGTEIITTKTCLYTYSDDEHFIIDHLPGYSNRVTIACGFSGHGFKFVSVVGEILADLATKGRTDLPVDFLRLSRFKK